MILEGSAVTEHAQENEINQIELVTTYGALDVTFAACSLLGIAFAVGSGLGAVDSGANFSLVTCPIPGTKTISSSRETAHGA